MIYRPRKYMLNTQMETENMLNKKAMILVYL